MKSKVFFIMLVMVVFLTSISGAQQKPADVAGEWAITISFIVGTGHHTAIIEQDGEKLSGTYKGEILEGGLRGTVTGNNIDFSGSLRHESTGVRFHYTGTIEGDTMKGTVEMGEYWSAEWTAKRKK